MLSLGLDAMSSCTALIDVLDVLSCDGMEGILGDEGGDTLGEDVDLTGIVMDG